MRYHPRDLEFLSWLATLPAEEEYVTRCAFIRAHRSFQNDWDFKGDTETLRAQIDPDAVKLSNLWKAARERAEPS